jgi:hypothetical protein
VRFRNVGTNISEKTLASIFRELRKEVNNTGNGKQRLDQWEHGVLKGTREREFRKKDKKKNVRNVKKQQKQYMK